MRDCGGKAGHVRALQWCAVWAVVSAVSIAAGLGTHTATPVIVGAVIPCPLIVMVVVHAILLRDHR